MFSNPAIFHVSGLAKKLEQFFERYREVHLDDKQLRQFAKKLVKMHAPKKWEIEIDWTKGRKGVLCPACAYQNTMHYVYGKWFCDVCKETDSRALFVALHDYRLMMGDSISNSQFRDFFELSSAKTVYRKLKLLGFEVIGGNKNRRYLIPEDVLKHL